MRSSPNERNFVKFEEKTVYLGYNEEKSAISEINFCSFFEAFTPQKTILVGSDIENFRGIVKRRKVVQHE